MDLPRGAAARVRCIRRHYHRQRKQLPRRVLRPGRLRGVVRVSRRQIDPAPLPDTRRYLAHRTCRRALGTAGRVSRHRADTTARARRHRGSVLLVSCDRDLVAGVRSATGSRFESWLKIHESGADSDVARARLDKSRGWPYTWARLAAINGTEPYHPLGPTTPLVSTQ